MSRKRSPKADLTTRERAAVDVAADLEAFGGLPVRDDDLVTIGQPLDFLGVNYYYPHYAVDCPAENDFHLNNSGRPGEGCRFALKNCFAFVENPKGRYTNWHWEIDPDSLERLLVDLSYRFPELPLLVTENGIGLPDQLVDGEVDDQPRIDFVREHLRAIGRAIAAGAPVGGYFMWSLLDNFSWVNGYKKRYGFLHVDRATMKRTVKNSARWFKDVAHSNRLD